MRSRWDDVAAKNLDGLDLLVYASRLIGTESSLVVWGGGNTSIKRVERDYRGRETRVLRVKGSGSDLKSIEKKHFPGVRMDDILALLERKDMGDQEMVDYLAHALQEPASPRPSIETLLHGFVDAHAVVHTHADAIVSLTNNDRCRPGLRRVYGDEVIYVPWQRPGFDMGLMIESLIKDNPQAKGVLLGHHGMSSWSHDDKACYETALDIIDRAAALLLSAEAGAFRFHDGQRGVGRRVIVLVVEDHLRSFRIWRQGNVSEASRTAGAFRDLRNSFATTNDRVNARTNAGVREFRSVRG